MERPMRKDSRNKITPRLETLEGKLLLSGAFARPHPQAVHVWGQPSEKAIGGGSVQGIAKVELGHLHLNSSGGKINGLGSVRVSGDIYTNPDGGNIIVTASRGRAYRLAVDNVQVTAHVNKMFLSKTTVYSFAITYHNAESNDPRGFPDGRLIISARIGSIFNASVSQGTYTGHFFVKR
jgi:hypothetical protein